MEFAIFYLVCGLFAAFTYILVTPEHFTSSVPMGGASGAISGCLGGFLLLRAATRIKFKWVIIFWFRIWHGLFLWPAWLVISFWFLDDLTMTIFTRLDRTQSGGGAFAARRRSTGRHGNHRRGKSPSEKQRWIPANRIR